MTVKLIFGCGYLGARVAARWREAGATVCVVTRSAERAEQFRREGYEARVADIMQPDTLALLPAAEIVLFAVGYDRRSQRPIEEVYVDGLRNVLDALPQRTGRLIYVSSTGVYGDAQGKSVDETSPCRPTRPGGIACLAAETVLRTHALGQRAIILRLAGLYGPGRIPAAEALLKNQPITAPGAGYLNLIHVDDAATVVLAAEHVQQVPACYTVSDGHPCPRREYFDELARQLGAQPPRFAPAENVQASAARAADDKRVDNTRMMNELGVALRYPTYRDGLRQIVAQDDERRQAREDASGRDAKQEIL